MPVRSLNGLDSSVRSLNGLSDRIDYTVSLPLTMNSDYNIKLSNLTSYGSANQILKMNGTGTFLEFTTETDTTYTNGTNITISGENAISSDQKTTLTFNTGQKLKGTGNSTNIRDIAYVDSNNDIIFGDSQNNCGFSVSTGIYFLGDSTPLISNLRLFSSSGINNLGDINNLSGNINLTNENKINFNNDANNSIGSQNVLNGVELKGFNNVLITTSVSNKPSIKISQISIKCKGKITGQFLTGTEEMDLLQLTQNDSIQLGDSSTNTKYVCSAGGGLYINSVVNPVLTGTGTANLQGLNVDAGDINIESGDINMRNGKKIIFNGMVDDLNFIGSDTTIGGVFLQGANKVKIGTQGGNASAILTVKTDKINCKGKISGQFTSNGTERDLLQLTQNESIQLGDANTNIKYVCSGGLYMNSVVNPVLKANGTANLQGLTLDTGDLNMFCPNKIRFNNDIYNYIHCDSNIGSTGLGGINIIGFGAIKLALSRTPASTNEASILIEGQNVNVVGDIRTLDDMYVEGSYRIISPSVFLPAPELDSDNYMNYGTAYGRGPDLHGFSGVKFWVRNPSRTDDVRFYILHNLVNCRADFYLNGVQQFTSDDRLKTDEEDLPFNCLELLDKMKPKQYKKYNDKLEYTHNELGLIAQDTWNTVKDNDILRDIFVSDIDYNLESNFKENGDLVEDQQKIGENGEIITNYLYINYISFVPILIQSVKDLNTIVKQQQEQINKQQIIIDKLINSTTFANFKKNI